jgi:hypothetical protein
MWSFLYSALGWFVAVVPSDTLRADIEVSGVYCLHGFGVMYSKVVVVTAFATEMASSAAKVTSRQRSRLVAIVLVATNMMRCPTALESRAFQ